MAPGNEVTIKIWLDEEHQIIRQILAGNLTEEGARIISVQTQACADRLKNPGEVRILVDARKLGKGDSNVRKHLVADLKRPNFKGMALFGGAPVVRTFLKFYNIITCQDKMAFFKTEAEALAWLIK